MPPAPPSLAALLRTRAEHTPDAHAFRFLGAREGEVEDVTYAGLHAHAASIAARLDVPPGARVLLLHPPGIGYIAAFFGCLLAGAIPVPTYPPRNNQPLARLRALLLDAGAQVAIATPSLVARLARELAGIRWVTAEDEGAAGRDPSATAGEIAFLQYTSGSTGTPKGVMVTHANVLANVAAIATRFRVTPETRGVVWLPPFHDMGLVGGILVPLAVGHPCTLLAPATFLVNPARWLETVSRERATVSGGPDFAWALCTRRVPDEVLPRLDLSAWEVAFTGAEPVRGATLDAFAERFGSCGFRRTSWLPCYGLAEATLIVSGALPGTGATRRAIAAEALERGTVEPGDREVTSCGVAAQDTTIAIVDPAGEPVPPGRVGEIVVRGPGVAAGYWGRPVETAETFGGGLRTGDLGFVADGELYVTGRAKDVVKLRGRNLFPQDLERTAETAHPDLRPHGSAAFGVEVDGEERLVVVVEVEPRRTPDPDVVTHAVRAALADAFDVTAYAVVPIPAGGLPRTSSGKIRRAATRAAWEAGALTGAPKRASEAEVARSEAEIYDSLEARFARLDRRSTTYQYDLERDIDWRRIDEPGVHLTGPMLRLDPAGLASRPDLHDTWQWILGVSMADRFVVLETVLLEFTRRERARLGPTRSLDLLEAEEVKHIATFRRYAEHLRARRPDLLPDPDTYFAEELALFRRVLHAAPGSGVPPAQVHFRVWLLILLFEEYTVHVHRLLSAEPDGVVQPVWAQANAAHAREETQHILTDAAYLAALRIEEEDRFNWSRELWRELTQEYANILVSWHPLLHRHLRPDVRRELLAWLRTGEVPDADEGGVLSILRERTFARTLAAAPYFAYALQHPHGQPTPEHTAAAAPVREWLRDWVATRARLPRHRVDPKARFAAYGLDSLQLVSLSGELGQHVGRRLAQAVAYDYPTIELLAAHAVEAPEEATPLPAVRRDRLPLTARQERLWHLMKAEPAGVLDHVTVVYELPEVRVDLLNAVLARLAERHEALRTRLLHDAPAQRVSDDAVVPLRIRAAGAGGWEGEAAAVAAEQDAAPFGFDELLWRATAIPGESGEGALVLTVHHAVTDGWSMDVLWRELSAAYLGALAGRPWVPAAPAGRFSDAGLREAAWLPSKDATARLAWWREHLADHPGLGAPPMRRASRPFVGGAVSGRVPAALVERCKALARARGATLYLVLLTAFVEARRRRCGHDDVLVNTHLFNRGTEEERGTVGYFVNILTLRPRLADAADPVRAVQAAWMDALEHAIPIDHLVRALYPDAYADRRMPSDAAFNLLSVASAEDAPARSLRRRADLTPPPGFLYFEEMLVAWLEADGGLGVTVWFDAATVSASRAEETFAEWCAALERLAE